MRAKLGANVPAPMDEEAAALDRMIEFAVERAKHIGLSATSDLLMMARKSVHESRSRHGPDGDSAIDEAICWRALH